MGELLGALPAPLAVLLAVLAGTGLVGAVVAYVAAAARRRRPVAPSCTWAGAHHGGAVCFVEIARECGHVERDISLCLAHAQALLATGGAARQPAPCFDATCNVVSVARVTATQDLPPMNATSAAPTAPRRG